MIIHNLFLRSRSFPQERNLVVGDEGLFNLGLDFPQRFPTAIRAVTPEQV